MTETAHLEELLRQVLERLERQERRMEAFEAAVAGRTPSIPPPRPVEQTPPPTVFAAPGPTPPMVPWPRRAEPVKPAAPDRVKELEARLAEAEDRLRLANRLETVGRLIAGVAHDFNNLLTVIVGNAETIQFGLEPDHPLRESAEQIATAALSAANVTRQLVTYGRPSRPAPGPVDANVAVRAVERVLRRLIGERVTLEVSLASTLPLIQADPGQFDQVMLNLAVNARDAIAADGTVTIRTAVATIPDGHPGWPSEVPCGEFVAVTVTDTGTGMSDEIRARMFDPFFTTKEGRGSGLGMATVRDIVRGAGGHIEVESSPGWGTSVRVFWPVLPQQPPPAPLRLVP